MNQEKIGNLIKEIRKKNNLTQKDLAEKYGVTYQAVSKWENGKNMPDISLLRKISEDFNINIEDMLDGKLPSKKYVKRNYRLIILFIVVVIVLIFSFIIYKYTQNESFEFKTISTNCDHFEISGSIAYNQTKSSIYISNISYCGEHDNTDYQKIECSLYEKNNNIETIIDSYNYLDNNTIKLDDFLKDITFNIDDYTSTCKKYQKDTLYLLINATDTNGKITTYKIPLELEDNCTK